MRASAATGIGSLLFCDQDRETRNVLGSPIRLRWSATEVANGVTQDERPFSNRRRHSSQTPKGICIVAIRGAPSRRGALAIRYLVGPREHRVRHAGDFLAEILQLRLVKPIGLHGIESYVLRVFACCHTLFAMALRECRVTLGDVRDIDHSVTVHADTNMDAAALGLKRIRDSSSSWRTWPIR